MSLNFNSRSKIKNLLQKILIAVSVVLVLVLTIVVSFLYINYKKLPDVNFLSEYEFEQPIRILTKDNKLIGEIGVKKRVLLQPHELPDMMKKALLATEDANFYRHSGVDVLALMRSVLQLVSTGRIKSGASTITMQVAREYFLNRSKTFSRKFTEILLAIKIERHYSKDEILMAYVNKIFLGKRSYGFEAAAKTYYNKPLSELTLDEYATLAGIPKGPSIYNPISNPIKAHYRRNYVLSRMLAEKYITDKQYRKAILAKNSQKEYNPSQIVDTGFILEYVRQIIYKQFDKSIIKKGLYVYTTIDSKAQKHAIAAFYQGLNNYTDRHGFIKTNKSFNYKDEFEKIKDEHEYNEDTITDDDIKDLLYDFLSSQPKYIGLMPAIITKILPEDNTIAAITFLDHYGKLNETLLNSKSFSNLKPYIDTNTQGASIQNFADNFTANELIYIREVKEQEDKNNKIIYLDNWDFYHNSQNKDEIITTRFNNEENKKLITKHFNYYYRLASYPLIESGLVSLDANNGAIKAFIGGVDHNLNKFNHASQIKRQAGSGFKPILYSAALEKGYTPATIINDAPVVFQDAALEADWKPQNDSKKFLGPTRLRVALASSRNLVSVRILQDIGVDALVEYAQKFAIPKESLEENKNLSLSLGSVQLSPLIMAQAFAIFANSGFKVKAHIIDKIYDSENNLVYQDKSPIACITGADKNVKNLTDIKGYETIAPNSQSIANLEKALNDSTDSLHQKSPCEVADTPLARRVITPENAFIMTSIMQDVIKYGTGKKALSIKRSDLAGKTGTTNQNIDAWFSGFNPDIVTSVWSGFDIPETLGHSEFGSSVALPIWIDYMQNILKNYPQKQFFKPNSITDLYINPTTGDIVKEDEKGALEEFFIPNNIPEVNFEKQEIEQLTEDLFE